MVFSVQDIRVERSTECRSGKLSLPIQEIELVVEKPQTLIRATQERKCERYPISLCIFDVVLWQLNRIKTQFSGCVTVCGSLELQKNKRRSCFEIEYLCISKFFIFPVCCFLFAFFSNRIREVEQRKEAMQTKFSIIFFSGRKERCSLCGICCAGLYQEGESDRFSAHGRKL